MKSFGIIWNGAFEFRKEIVSDIQKVAIIEDYEELELGDCYDNFVYEIYKKDGIESWKVEKKLESMKLCTTNTNIAIIFFDIPVNNVYYHDKKKKQVFQEAESLKTGIREKYGELVNYYFFDNVFHMTDDEKEYKDNLFIVKELINKYKDKKIKIKKVGE